jgi:UDP-galactopyranose mutase
MLIWRIPAYSEDSHLTNYYRQLKRNSKDPQTNKMEFDYLIVGTGLTGAVIARAISDQGLTVLLVDRRGHQGGNVHDHHHPSGIPIHTYGPHYFRTNDESIWQFVNRFSSFEKYEAVVKSSIRGQLEDWPITSSYIRREIGAQWKPGFTGTPTNFEEASLSLMPKEIYDRFVGPYSQKQWGISPKLLSTNLARRFDVRDGDDRRLVQHKYQGIPSLGYSQFMVNMVSGIPVMLNLDYIKNRSLFNPRRGTIFTGALDEFFGFDIGRLKYRGQKRTHQYLADTSWAQPCGQVNNPELESGPHIRTLEWKHMMPKEHSSRIAGTVLTREVPFSPTNPEEFEYPFPDSENSTLFSQYRNRARLLEKILICGRLGEYRYYDMDQAIARARLLARRILDGQPLNQVIGEPK